MKSRDSIQRATWCAFLPTTKSSLVSSLLWLRCTNGETLLRARRTNLYSLSCLTLACCASQNRFGLLFSSHHKKNRINTTMHNQSPTTPEGLLQCLDESALIARSAVSELLRVIAGALSSSLEEEPPVKPNTPFLPLEEPRLQTPTVVPFSIESLSDDACLGVNSARLAYPGNVKAEPRWVSVEVAFLFFSLARCANFID